MTTKTRRRTHIALAVFFAAQIPIALAAQVWWPDTFEVWWKQYLIFISLYAIVSTHWTGASSETPMDDEA